MNLAITYSRATCGIDAPLITVETHLANGLPSLAIVGLPEAAVKESKDRVRSAIANSGFNFPARRITINLAPADLPKSGGRFDLPIALAILAASGQIPAQALAQFEFIGELALTGELRPVSGVLPSSIHCSHEQRTLIVPSGNAAEASLPSQAQVLQADSLLEVTAHLLGQESLGLTAESRPETPSSSLDMADIKGQQAAKRALEIAAAGGHNLLMIGPPGTGKTMLASRLAGILPPMTEDEALQTAAVQSISHYGFHPRHWQQRPFRAPHHTASAVALVGGGSHPKPGEISLSHRGVLFLDELPEFDRKVLEVLREPLESGHIVISRASRQTTYPAEFQLIAAMNPCPCGFLGDPKTACRCSPDQIQRYHARLSGPLLDRIDIHIEVARNAAELLAPSQAEEDTQTITRRVVAAHAVQLQRQGKTNRELNTRSLEQHCALDEENQQLLAHAIDKLNLSGRAYHRILKVARTIADLTGSKTINQEHLLEALNYRRLERLQKFF